MSSNESFTGPTVIISGGGGGAPRIAKGVAEAIPEARVILGEAIHDGGGSSGRLRDELGIPAVGDISSGIAAFAPPEISALINHRYGPKSQDESIAEAEM